MDYETSLLHKMFFLCCEAIIQCIERIENARATQTEVDNLYNEFCNIYYSAMVKWYTVQNINSGAKKTV